MRTRTAHTILGIDRQDADFLVQGRIEPRAGGFRTVLLLEDAAGRELGTRTLDSTTRSCPALDESLLLALEMLVDTPKLRELARAKREAPTEASSEPTTERTTEVPPEGAVSPTSDTPNLPIRSMPSPSTTASPKRHWRFDVGFGASTAAGFAPKPTVGPAAHAMMRPPGFVPIALRGALYPLAVERVSIPGEGSSVRAFVAGIDLCPLALARGRFEGLACTGFEVGGLHAEPIGPKSNAGDLLFPLVPVRAEMRARIGNFVPYAAFTMRFSPTEPKFTYESPPGTDRAAFLEPRVTAALDVGLVWRFPSKD
ncbi:hypothetical protein AKJ09_10601 [Labilithrix luteola]|uniref:Uncharacterized protein n=1 Tax=Labilithrix luteola TaxID=1391654 RepID=A0A0K1QDZ0_9BACT|nr:hypothetical protein [Labilithrix luteola]AKV03938.1 hypothetical protein AKJ09_10601 [Labilithrix luteola]